ncbi:MAG: carboxypeptidase regulatory-like domain-containing protein [Planctomycetota bacterium]|jgi:hypothetical protein
MARRKRKALLGSFLLLLLLAWWLPFGDFLSGVLPGGGWRDNPDAGAGRTHRAGTLRVTILRALDRKPVSGARIQVTGFGDARSEAVSDGSGQARLTGLEHGPVRVEARSGSETASMWVDAKGGGQLELALAPSRKRRGQVTDRAGKPVSATVRLMDRDGRELASTHTDEHGHYEIEDAREALSLCVEPKDAAPAVLIDGDVEVDPGDLLNGRLLGGGEGQLEIYGRLHVPDDDGLLPFRARWPLGGDGRFTGRLPKGASAWAVYRGVPLRLKGGDLEMPELVPLRGQVKRPGGEPATRAVVTLRPLLDADFPVPLPALTVRTNRDGTFRADTARVRYAVEVAARGCATRRFPDLVPGPDPLSIELEPGYSLIGRVTDQAGLPVPDALVRAISRPDPKGLFPVVRVHADSHGRYALHGLGGESALLDVSAPGFRRTTLDGIRTTRQVVVELKKE